MLILNIFLVIFEMFVVCCFVNILMFSLLFLFFWVRELGRVRD